MATRWSALTNWARQERKLLASGLGAGIALGGGVWLILALSSPGVPTVDELAVDNPSIVADASQAAPQSALPASDVPVATAPLERAPLDRAPSIATSEVPHGVADPIAGEKPDASSIAPHAPAPTANEPQTTAPAVPPAAADEKTPPVASAPRPTIKLEPAPADATAASTESNRPAEPDRESMVDSASADDPPETAAAVRTPADDSPGDEQPAITAAEVDERLSRALPAAQFTKVPLFQFVEFVAEFTSLPIQLDEPALKRVGKSRQTAVTVKLDQTTAGDALRTALSELGLVTSLREGVMLITAAPDAAGKSPPAK
jgi:hypothetical protein